MKKEKQPDLVPPGSDYIAEADYRSMKTMYQTWLKREDTRSMELQGHTKITNIRFTV